jgi:putative ABC transport system permease protein
MVEGCCNLERFGAGTLFAFSQGMETLFADVRFGLRLLLQKPGLTLVAVLTLALGVGANTAIFSVVNGVLLRPLPYAEPENLLMVWQDHSRLEGSATEWASFENFSDWREQSEVFGGVFAFGNYTATLRMPEPEQIQGASVSHDALSILGIAPLLGRGFRPEEDSPKAELVALLSHSLWQRSFGSDRGVLGQRITLGEAPATVIGVLPPNTMFPHISDPEIFVPLRIDPSTSCGRGCVNLRVVARLASGVSLERASADMEAIALRLEREYPEENRGVGVNLVPLHEQLVGTLRPALLALLGAVSFVLLIACANVASLLLARAVEREKEVATRVAMGAGRARLLRQLLTESFLLALAGASLGAVIALWGVDVLLALVPGGFPRLEEVTVDRRVLGFTLALAAASAFLFGLVPALRGSKPDVHRCLKEGARGSSRGGAHRFRRALVVLEVALALSLLVGASLLLESFRTLTRVDPGFDPKNLLTAGLDLSSSTYDDPSRRIAFLELLQERASGLAGAESAGAVFALPMGGADADAGFLIEGKTPPEPRGAWVAWYRPVTPSYFATMRMRLSRGRFLRESDDAEAPPVVLVNELATRSYWPNEDPLLSRVRIGGAWRQVVGVVEDTRHFGLDRSDRPAMYFPYAQLPQRSMNLVVRAESDPESLAVPLRRALAEIDPRMALADLRPLEEVISGTVATPRVTSVLFAVFALSALALSAIGLYGVLSYSVGSRIREIGIRMALGANKADVLRQTVGEGVLLLGLGTAIGLGVAFVLSRLLASLLFRVSPTDPFSFLGAFAVLAAVAILACYLPARRAARVDPIVVLRYE